MNTKKTERLTTLTRLVAIVVLIMLALAFVSLSLEPTHTDQYFTWPILPSFTPMFMGAGYVAGAYFFVRVGTETK